MSLAQDNFAAASAAVTTRHLVAADDPSGRFARDALARDKRESLDLAGRARWAALAVVGAMLPVLNFQWEVLYYEALLLVFALIGWGQRRVGTVGRSRPELLLMFCDIALLTIVCVVPNPFGSSDWPTAMQYRFENFVYFYVLLAGAALAYSWRTMVAMGVWTTGMWTLGVLYVWSRPDNFPELSAAAPRSQRHSLRSPAAGDRGLPDRCVHAGSGRTPLGPPPDRPRGLGARAGQSGALLLA